MQRDHTQEYYLDLKNQIGELRASTENNNGELHAVAEKTSSEQMYFNVAFIIIAAILAILAFVAEIRFSKLSNQLLKFTKKFSGDGGRKTSK